MQEYDSQYFRLFSLIIYTKTLSVTMKVRHNGGSTRRKSEFNVQELSPTLLYRYWDWEGGYCDSTGFTQYRPFKILNCKPVDVLVQWVRYPVTPTDTTWKSFDDAWN